MFFSSCNETKTIQTFGLGATVAWLSVFRLTSVNLWTCGPFPPMLWKTYIMQDVEQSTLHERWKTVLDTGPFCDQTQ